MLIWFGISPNHSCWLWSSIIHHWPARISNYWWFMTPIKNHKKKTTTTHHTLQQWWAHVIASQRSLLHSVRACGSTSWGHCMCHCASLWLMWSIDSLILDNEYKLVIGQLTIVSLIVVDSWYKLVICQLISVNYIDLYSYIWHIITGTLVINRRRHSLWNGAHLESAICFDTW